MVHGHDVKRIVLTSTIGTIRKDTDPTLPPANEDVWNEVSVREAAEKGRSASGTSKYCASKVRAERAAWEFMKTYGSGVAFDFVTIHPSWVYGPPVLLSLKDDLSTSMKLWWGMLQGSVEATKLLDANG